MSDPPRETPVPEDLPRFVVEGQAVYRLPTEGYLGLPLDEARARALAEGRERGRAVLVWRRLRVALDAQGRVAEADAG